MRIVLLSIICLWVTVSGCATQEASEKAEKKEVRQYVETDTGRWLIHDVNRPAPPVITPGQPGKAPSDAIVLFDGTDLSQWTDTKGDPTKWIMGDGYMECVKGSGYIQSKRKFGSCQLHVEFATPATVKGDGQGRGNSGVFLMANYEVQVLDSYNNKTYPDGQCAALYGRAVPLVNACRRPGEWQSYDVVFHRPIFKGKKVVRKPTFTVFHNGVLVQDHVELQGGTDWRGPHAISDFKPHEDRLPISLQDHGNPVRYRNIWVRELAD
ncbi:MAG: DUF1080 domain-containing protein [Sedimentisphaerales bacterium]|nr:DUF1080 domain-containing protein [Sedimentisphaerales bacterium]